MPVDVILKIVLEVAKRGYKLYQDIEADKTKYADLTPEQIEELLMPRGWAASEIRAAADAKAGVE